MFLGHGEKTCQECGAVWYLTKENLIVRDPDSIECDFCGHTLHSWTGAKMYAKELVSGPTNPKYKPKSDSTT